MPAYMCSTKYLHINIKCCGRELRYAKNQDSSRETFTQAKLWAALRWRVLWDAKTHAWLERHWGWSLTWKPLWKPRSAATVWPYLSLASLWQPPRWCRGLQRPSIMKHTRSCSLIRHDVLHRRHPLNCSQPANTPPPTKTFLGNADGRHSFVI